jgi:hypothetical protein
MNQGLSPWPKHNFTSIYALQQLRQKTNIVAASQAINIAYLLSLFRLNNFTFYFTHCIYPWAFYLIPTLEYISSIIIKTIVNN